MNYRDYKGVNIKEVIKFDTIRNINDLRILINKNLNIHNYKNATILAQLAHDIFYENLIPNYLKFPTTIFIESLNIYSIDIGEILMELFSNHTNSKLYESNTINIIMDYLAK